MEVNEMINMLSLIRVIALVSQVFLLANINPTYVTGLAIDKSSVSSQSVQVATKSPPTQYVSAGQMQYSRADRRRPVWNLAHMVNSIKELDYRLSKGANAIEADVTFSHDGNPLFTFHGPPCDCWRHCHQQEDFNDYLAYVGEITHPNSANSIGNNMSLLFLDLKLDYLDHSGKARAGVELAKSVAHYLFVNPDNLSPSADNGLRLILSVNHVTDVELVNNFVHQMEQSNSSWLMERIGFDVGMNDDLKQIETMWRRFGTNLNIWQGDGYTNCISPFYNLKRLSEAISRRDTEHGYPIKVYHWTIDLHDRIRESLRMGVDAIMTNHPERMLEILKEPEMAQLVRLATKEDDPFKKTVSSRASARESARYQRSASSATSGGFIGNVIDVIYSWWDYMKEIPFFSLPTTSRFIPKVKRHKLAASNLVALKSTQPEYRRDDQTTTSSDNSTANTVGQTDSISISDSLDNSIQGNPTQATDQTPYGGPKWYVTLLSGLLVSALKIVLPVHS